jgi:negative regulator of sigma E activity
MRFNLKTAVDRLLTLEDTLEHSNPVLESKPDEREKKSQVAFMRALQAWL